jgi:hypothetical protein
VPREWRPARVAGRQAGARPPGRAIEPVHEEQATSRRGWRPPATAPASWTPVGRSGAALRAGRCFPMPTPLPLQGSGPAEVRDHCQVDDAGKSLLRAATPALAAQACLPRPDRPGSARGLRGFQGNPDASSSWRGPSPTLRLSSGRAWRGASRSRRCIWHCPLAPLGVLRKAIQYRPRRQS